MKGVLTHPILKVLPWLALVLGLGLSVLISTVTVNAENLMFLLLCYIGVILPLVVIAITWLIVAHRKYFTNGWVWIIPIILLLISNLPVGQPTISMLLSLSLLTSLWAIGVATAILLWYRDLGLKLLGRVLVAYVWMLVLAWRLQGNLIDLWIQDINHLTGESLLWWLNPLWCVVGWVIPLSLLSIAGHTVRLVWREFRYHEAD